MEIVQLLAAGGNLAQIALLFVAWRFDKRVSRLEVLEEIRTQAAIKAG